MSIQNSGLSLVSDPGCHAIVHFVETNQVSEKMALSSWLFVRSIQLRVGLLFPLPASAVGVLRRNVTPEKTLGNPNLGIVFRSKDLWYPSNDRSCGMLHSMPPEATHYTAPNYACSWRTNIYGYASRNHASTPRRCAL